MHPARAPRRLAALATILAASACGPALGASSSRPVAVENAVPSRSFTGHVELSQYNPVSQFGPATGIGTLGIASLTLTNLSSIPQYIVFEQAVVDSSTGRCAQSTTRRGPSLAEAVVAPNSTLHLAYPQMLVVPPYENVNCVVSRIRGNIGEYAVEIYVTGLVD